MTAASYRDKERPVATPGSETVRKLIASIADNEAERDRGEADIAQAIELVRQANLGAYRIPSAAGGGGASYRELIELVISLAEADSNIPHILRNHFAFVERALRNRGPKHEIYLREVLNGKLIGLGATELGVQNVGRDSVEALLKRRQEKFVLNGRKFYNTGNKYSDFIQVYCITEEGTLVSAMISRDAPGVDIRDDWDGIGQKLTASGTMVLTEVEVNENDVIYAEDEPNKVTLESTYLQIFLTSIITGILRSVVNDATALLKSRDRNYYYATASRPADDPLLQQIIGRIASIAYVAEASVLRAADALSAGLDAALEGRKDDSLFVEASLRAAKSKIIVDSLALGAATELFDVGGASATLERKRLDRHWRNIRTISSHNPNPYKARAIGNHIVNGEPLPNKGFF